MHTQQPEVLDVRAPLQRLLSAHRPGIVTHLKQTERAPTTGRENRKGLTSLTVS